MTRFLEAVAEEHLRTAQKVWEKAGRMPPTFWAQGMEKMIVAQASDRANSDQIDDRVLGVLATALAVQVDAIVIGRSDEALVRTGIPDSLTPGSVRRLADNDPEVRSCVITEAVLVGGSDEVTLVASHGLDDWGRHNWETVLRTNSTMATLLPLRAARDALKDPLPEFWHDRNALEQFAEQIRWTVQMFPKQTSW